MCESSDHLITSELLSGFKACNLCPHKCGVDRTGNKTGVCNASSQVKIARAALHYWEEPPISGENGSGAVFFSHCTLKCIFCQNKAISQGGFGSYISLERLSEIYLELQDKGAHNINLVSPSQYVYAIVPTVKYAREKSLHIPIVYNSSGYEREETLDLLRDTVNVWLPDYKYTDDKLARNLSRAPGYSSVALKAIETMLKQVEQHGGRIVDNGIMKQGIIVRHLVLPGHEDDSMNVLSTLWNAFGNRIDVSIMSQYTPPSNCEELNSEPSLLKPLEHDMYEAVLDWADMLGFENLWWQEGDAVGESFIPEFDLSGVFAPEHKKVEA